MSREYNTEMTVTLGRLCLENTSEMTVTQVDHVFRIQVR